MRRIEEGIRLADKIAPEYSIIMQWVDPGSSVLDLGCGDGKLLSFLVQQRKIRPQGIDIDESMIQKCVERGLSVFNQDIDTGLSEYPDKSFDYVILNNSLQQVKKPDYVLNEGLRVGRKTIVSFPNFAHYSSRFQIFFGGKVPITHALPYAWYDTPNLHFLSISDFFEFCTKRGIRTKEFAFTSGERRVRFFSNFFAETGLFVLSNEKNSNGDKNGRA
jgi:methionine biosynthesis protein MetW